MDTETKINTGSLTIVGDKLPVCKKPKDMLREHLKELIEQWESTAYLYSTQHDMKAAASGYYECISELKEILNGDLSAIEKW